MVLKKLSSDDASGVGFKFIAVIGAIPATLLLSPTPILAASEGFSRAAPFIQLADASLFPASTIAKAQRALNFFGHNAGQPDGVWGPQTGRAFSAWGIASGITNGSTTPSRATMGLLIEAYENAGGR